MKQASWVAAIRYSIQPGFWLHARQGTSTVLVLLPSRWQFDSNFRKSLQNKDRDSMNHASQALVLCCPAPFPATSNRNHESSLFAAVRRERFAVSEVPSQAIPDCLLALPGFYWLDPLLVGHHEAKGDSGEPLGQDAPRQEQEKRGRC
jgi:hypothetical protein